MMVNDKKGLTVLLKEHEKLLDNLEIDQSDIQIHADMIHNIYGDKEHLCIRCRKPLLPSQVHGYKYQCLTCYEDFYSFESIDNR